MAGDAKGTIAGGTGRWGRSLEVCRPAPTDTVSAPVDAPRAWLESALPSEGPTAIAKVTPTMQNPATTRRRRKFGGVATGGLHLRGPRRSRTSGLIRPGRTHRSETT